MVTRRSRPLAVPLPVPAQVQGQAQPGTRASPKDASPLDLLRLSSGADMQTILREVLSLMGDQSRCHAAAELSNGPCSNLGPAQYPGDDGVVSAVHNLTVSCGPLLGSLRRQR